MDESSMKFNLLDEQWIPVLYHNGECRRVSIRTALRDARRIRQIAASSPMDRVAVLRFLLAILYWCRGDPPDDAKEQMTEDGFPDEWFAEKFKAHHDCFNLLGEGKRFYQVADAKRPRPVSDLIHEIPTGNNFWHFQHSEP